MITFTYGTMGAGKTKQLIWFYKQHAKDFNGLSNIKVMRFKLSPKDTNTIESRDGSKIFCELFDNKYDFEKHYFYEQWTQNFDYILIDEVQFCTREQIEQLHRIGMYMSIYCYGLLLDNCGLLFNASKTLIEYGAILEKIPSRCRICGCKATISAMYLRPTKRPWLRIDGETPSKPYPPSKDTQYIPMCKRK